MTIAELFNAALKELKKTRVRFALAGGMAASLYRDQARTTMDLDFLILAKKDSRQIAEKVIRSLGLTPNSVTKAVLEGGPQFAIKRGTGPIYMTIGRDPHDKDAPGLDFILPEMPWFESAMERAQQNLIDFGFGAIPCLSPEDIFISKLYSLYNDSTRLMDLSDLSSILATQKEIDVVYISNQMRKLKLLLPREFAKEAPPILKKADKEIRRSFKK